MSSQDRTSGEAGDWEVELLRLTTFHSPSSFTPDPSGWWKQAIGNEPDETVTRPRQGETLLTGEHEGRQLLLTVRPQRVDWGLQQIVGPELSLGTGAIPGSQTMAHLLPALESLKSVAAGWLGSSPDVIRLAFGAILLKKVPDIKSAYRILAPFLPNVTTPGEEASDFQYQINRPRQSRSIEGLRVNRLTKWSAMPSGTISVTIVPGARPELTTGSLLFASRLELDMNTSPESKNIIPQDQTNALFVELVHLGTEIADKGDVP